MKDEILKDTIIEACFLKVEAYCYRLQCNSVGSKVKGEDEKKFKRITEATIKNQITIRNYKSAINWGGSKYVTNCTINSYQYHLETREQYKIAIDPFDDKSIRDSIGEIEFYY